MSGMSEPMPCVVRHDLVPLLTPWFDPKVHGNPERSGVYQTKDAGYLAEGGREEAVTFYNYYDADYNTWHYGHKEPGKALQIGRGSLYKLDHGLVAAWRGLTKNVTDNFEKEITA